MERRIVSAETIPNCFLWDLDRDVDVDVGANLCVSCMRVSVCIVYTIVLFTVTFTH